MDRREKHPFPRQAGTLGVPEKIREEVAASGSTVNPLRYVGAFGYYREGAERYGGWTWRRGGG
jgi:hypothetical protein